MLFEKVRDSILQNKHIKETGGYIGIPLPFKRLADYYPVISKGDSIGILGGTGVGKSRFARYLGIYHVYKFYKETGYKTKIFYFPLEDNKEKVYKNILCHYLYEVHNITISVQELDSKGDRVLPDFIADILKTANDYFSDFEKVVTILDGYSEPQEIMDVLKKYAVKTGVITKYMVEIDGNMEEQMMYQSDIHTVVLLDNMSNVEKGQEHKDDRHAIVDMAKIQVRERLCNFFKFSVIQLLQNDFVTERQQFNSSGKSIMSKVEPSLASIGDAKTVARSMHIVFSLFNPSAFEFLRYPAVTEENADKAYDIGILGNKFRALKIIKNNDGDSGMRIGLMFNAFSETFDELPLPAAPEMKGIYDRLNKKGESKFVKSKNSITFGEEYEDAPF